MFLRWCTLDNWKRGSTGAVGDIAAEEVCKIACMDFVIGGKEASSRTELSEQCGVVDIRGIAVS